MNSSNFRIICRIHLYRFMNRKAPLYRFKMQFEFKIVCILDGEKRLLKALFSSRKQNGNNVLTIVSDYQSLNSYSVHSITQIVCTRKLLQSCGKPIAVIIGWNVPHVALCSYCIGSVSWNPDDNKRSARTIWQAPLLASHLAGPLLAKTRQHGVLAVMLSLRQHQCGAKVLVRRLSNVTERVFRLQRT